MATGDNFEKLLLLYDRQGVGTFHHVPVGWSPSPILIFPTTKEYIRYKYGNRQEVRTYLREWYTTYPNTVPISTTEDGEYVNVLRYTYYEIDRLWPISQSSPNKATIPTAKIPPEVQQWIKDYKGRV